MSGLHRALCADAMLVAVHICFAIAVLAGFSSGIPSMADLKDEASFAGLWMALKLGLASFFLWRTPGSAKWVAVAITVLFLDDVLEIHEALGDLFADSGLLPYVAGVDADDIGELVASAGLAIPVFGALWISIQTSTGPLRAAVFRFTALVVALGVAGVGLDFVHAIFERAGSTAHPFIAPTLAVLEDGLELVVATGLLFQALQIRELSTPAGNAARAEAGSPS